MCMRYNNNALKLSFFIPFQCSLSIKPRSYPGQCLSSATMSLVPCDPSDVNQQFTMAHQVSVTPYIASGDLTSFVGPITGHDGIESFFLDVFQQQCDDVNCKPDAVTARTHCPAGDSKADPAACDLSVSFSLDNSINPDDDHGITMETLKTLLDATFRTQFNQTSFQPQQNCKDCGIFGPCIELYVPCCCKPPPYTISTVPTQIKITVSEWESTLRNTITMTITAKLLPPPQPGGCPKGLTTAASVASVVSVLPVDVISGPAMIFATIVDAICSSV